jgi:hypothetical protein
MYAVLITILVLWFYSVYTFAKWRFHVCSQKGVVLENVLHDRLAKRYLRGTATMILSPILYIIY